MIPGWFGDRAVLVRTEGSEAREQAAHALERHREVLGPGAVIRRGIRDVLVEWPIPDTSLLERVSSALRDPAPSSASTGRVVHEHHIAVRYAGEDISSAASFLGVDSDVLVAAHQRQQWRVAMLGFAPGFGYLEPVGDLVLDWSTLERRSSPRPRVPRGSVAIAAGMSAIYPQDMPGGWHVIGVSSVALFDAAQTQTPSLLSAGDLVRFDKERS